MPVRLPDPVPRFAARAARLRQLADGHAARDWLLFLALISEAQSAAAREVTVPPAPAEPDGPPIRYDRVPRDGTWRAMLSVILGAVADRELPEEAAQTVAQLRVAGASQLEGLADLQLESSLSPEELGTAPFVGAALQTWFAVLASRLDPATLFPQGSACPACGAPPVAGLVDASTRRRYLSCSLCGVDWHLPRLCASCGDDSELEDFRVDGDAGARAEACGACRGYVKLFDLAKRPGAEPAADDAATLALDVLVSKAGFERIGSSHWIAMVG